MFSIINAPQVLMRQVRVGQVCLPLALAFEKRSDLIPGFFPTESQQSVCKHKQTVGELDNNPVSKAIARHLGIDISPEGRAARNRRGIAIVMHGAPLTGMEASGEQPHGLKVLLVVHLHRRWGLGAIFCSQILAQEKKSFHKTLNFQS